MEQYPPVVQKSPPRHANKGPIVQALNGAGCEPPVDVERALILPTLLSYFFTNCALLYKSLLSIDSDICFPLLLLSFVF